MERNMIKYDSGFCGLYENDLLIDASFLRWDGKRGTFYEYDTNNSGFEYYIDKNNNVYYSDTDGKNVRLWCSGKELNNHCHRLFQIKNR